MAEAARAAEAGSRARPPAPRSRCSAARRSPTSPTSRSPVPEIRRLEELRLNAAELAIDADLAAGRHQEVVPEIDALLAENPLRERLHAQRMLALYRCGRQGEALAAYRQARATLVEEIGIEPGPSCSSCTRRSCAKTRRWMSSRPGRAPARARPRGAAAADRPRR